MPKHTVIELTESDARVLQVFSSRKKETELVCAFSVDFSDLPSDDEETIKRGVRLRDALKKKKIQAATCGLIIPKQNAIVRTALLPSSDATELEGMARFEAEKYIPFNIERHIISNAVLRTDNVAGSQVLITAVDGPVMERALATLRNTRVEPLFAEVSSVSLVRAFSHYEHEAIQQPAVLLLNIGRSQADFAILKEGVLVAARSAALGIDQLNKSMEKASKSDETSEPQDIAANTIRSWINRIVRFTAQTYDFAVREYGIASTSCLYICGEGGTLQGLDRALAESLSIQVHHFKPIETMKRQANAQVDAGCMAGMTNCLGAALRMLDEEQDARSRGERINLLPLAVIEQQESSERKVLLMISSVMVVITLVLIYLAWDTQASHNKLLGEKYSKYNREMERPIRALDKKKEQLDIIQRITSHRAGVLEILDLISQFPGIGSTRGGGVLTIDDFKYTVRNEVAISGTTINFEDMQRFADYLERMTIEGKPVFETVGLPQPKPVDLSSGRGTVYAFTISCALTNYSSSTKQSKDRKAETGDEP